MRANIRSPTDKDYIKLRQIHVEAVGDFNNHAQESNFKNFVKYNSNSIKIALVDSRIAGYIIGFQENKKKVQINSLYVLPEYQGKGFGSSLVSSLEEEFGGKKIKFLSARIPRTYFQASLFFKKLDFDLITKINIYQKNDLTFPSQSIKEITIRPIRLNNNEDLKNISNLEQLCFSSFWFIEQDEYRRLLESEISSLFLAFIKKSDKLVGYNYNTLSINSKSGNYVRIATHPEYRLKGVATSLTAQAFKWFKSYNVRRVILTTYADSDLHNRIYQNWGFRKISDELIMAKTYS